MTRLQHQAQQGKSVDPGFETFYDECFRGVYRYVFARVQDTATAEDLTADAFFKAWRKWPPRETNGSVPKAWLFRIVRNLVVDHYRAEGRRPVESLDEIEVGDRRPNPGGDDHLDVLAVRVALASLSARDQDVLSLRLAGLSNEEIASLLQIDEGAAGMACLRALKRLRERVECGDEKAE
ncbi:MAG: RNA polymerase sigma factor [Anaerolineae bacterium]|nr:RNA polymerase sigma factor [Anaerolineae bacterium]